MKYRAGDKVKVRSDLKCEEYYGGVPFTSEMNRFKGMEFTIARVNNGGDYKVLETPYTFTDEMLEPVEEMSAEEAIKVLGEICCGNKCLAGCPISKAKGNYYTTGEQRTGCMFCGFGAHLEEEPNRFQRMSVTHPKCYEICMNLESNGVKYKDALETCGIGTETWEQMGQMDIFDFIGGMQ